MAKAAKKSTVLASKALERVAWNSRREALPEWYSCYLPIFTPEAGRRAIGASPVTNHEPKEGFVEDQHGEQIYIRSAVYGAYVKAALNGDFLPDATLEPEPPHLVKEQHRRSAAHERLHLTWRVWREVGADPNDPAGPRPLDECGENDVKDAIVRLLPRGPLDAVPTALPFKQAREALAKYDAAIDYILQPRQGIKSYYHNAQTLKAYDDTVKAYVAQMSVKSGVGYAKEWAMQHLGLRLHEAERTLTESREVLADKAAQVSVEQHKARILARLETIIDEGMGQWGDRKVALRALKEQAVILGIIKQENNTQLMLVNLTKNISNQIHGSKQVFPAGDANGDDMHELEDFGGHRAALLETFGEEAEYAP